MIRCIVFMMIIAIVVGNKKTDNNDGGAEENEEDDRNGSEHTDTGIFPGSFFHVNHLSILQFRVN